MNGSDWWDAEVLPELGDSYIRAILEAIRSGQMFIEWHTIKAEGLEFEICNPLAVGTAADHVYLFGLSSAAVDLIALELGDVMSPTPLLYDLAAGDDRQVQVGPNTQPNGKRGMRKDAAKQHSDAIKAPCGALISAACKTYVLHRYRQDPGPPTRPGYACEYGWRTKRLLSWGAVNASKTGWLLQPAQWAHLYRAFWDYSMGAVFVKRRAKLDGKVIDLGDAVKDPTMARRVSLSGPVPFLIHPDCPDDLAEDAPSEEPDDTAPSLHPRPSLRVGDRNKHVKEWQTVLITTGFPLVPFGADGTFGKLTADMTKRYQRAHGLVSDGIVGPRTWATAGAVHGVVASRPDFYDLLVNQAQSPPFKPLVGTSARQAVFGKFAFESAPSPRNPEAIRITDNWVQENIMRVNIPQLIGVPGAAPTGAVLFHKKGVDQLIGMFEAWERAGLKDRILSWAGSWVPRYIRGSRRTLSNHAFGSAFDINAPWNALGATPAEPGEKGSVMELVSIAHEYGFFWGGNFSRRPDGMHFELAEVHK